MKHDNICIMGTPAEQSAQGIENLLEEIVTKNFPNLVKEIDTQVQASQRVPNKMDPNRPTLRHIIIKMNILVKGHGVKKRNTLCILLNHPKPF